MNPFPFFEELKKNNNREWFAKNKSRYEEIRNWWIDGMEQVRAKVIGEWPEVGYSTIKTFRIYRDTRFSLDKTPYKTHIGSTIAPPGTYNVHNAGFYLEAGIPTEDCGVFCGVWAPENKVLNKLRHAIVDNIEEWEEIVSNPDLNRLYGDWFGERLKTAPKGWPKDHPQIEYLRLKHIGRQATITPAQYKSARWTDLIAERIIVALPLLRFLHYSLNEE